jgi:hypothetical protein
MKGKFMSAYPVRSILILSAALVVTLAGLPRTAPAADVAAKVPNIAGAWASYPGPRSAPPDPKLVAPPPGQLLLKAKYKGPYEELRARQIESDKRGEPLSNASTECLPTGMPQMMFAIYPIEFIQSAGQVTIIAEAMSQVRRVYLDKPQLAIEDVPPGYFGHSVGHWEGDTLVVDTVGVKESVLGFRDMPHSDQMRIHERIRLVAPDIMHDDITIEDPVVLDKPFTYANAYRRMPGYEVLEYVCENNRDYVDENGVTRMRLQPK